MLTLRLDANVDVGFNEDEGLDIFFILVNGQPVDEGAASLTFSTEVESDGDEDDDVTLEGEVTLTTT